MLGTVAVNLTDFLNPELNWRTAARGFRTSRKRSRIWANSVLKDARSPHRDWASVSESEKLGVAVLGRRFSDQVEHVPFKKMRLLRHSSPAAARNRPPPSLKSKLNKKRHGKGASVKCCSADLDYLPEAAPFEDKIHAVFSPINADKCFKDEKPLKFMCGKKHLDFSGIILLAATACSIINDIGDAKEESMADQSSAAKITETVASVTSVNAVLKEPVTSVDAVDEFVEDPSLEQKPTDAQDIPAAELQKAADVNANQSPPVKYHRLHWDLNTEMEAWGQPFDDGLSCPHGGSHSEIQKTEGGDPEHSVVPLGHYSVDNDIQSSAEICSFISVMQTREEFSLHDVYSGLPVEGKVTSVEGGNHEEDIREPPHFPGILRTEARQTVNGEHSMNKLGIMNSSCESLEQEENLCLSGTTAGEMQLGRVVNVLSKEKVVTTTDTSPIVYLQSNKSPDESAISSVISNVENHCMTVNERINVAQTGYESPFEDGELREDHVLYLGEEENEVGDEIDSLNFEDDGKLEHNVSNSCPQESSSPECQNMRKGNSSESLVQDGIGDDMMGLTQSASSNTKQPGRDQLPEGCEATSGRSVAINTVDSSDGLGSCAAESGPKAFGRNRLLSHLKGPSQQSDVIHRKDAVYAKQTGSNKLDEASALALEEREVGSDKCFRRISSSLQDKDQKDDDCVGSSASYWDLRSNNYLTSYHHHPLENHDYSRPIDEKPRGLNYHCQRQPISYSSKGASFMKPPCNTEGHCVEHKRVVSLRDDSRSRRRGSRPAATGQGFTRSTRNDFPCAAPDYLASDKHSLISAQMVHSLPQRDHGISHVPLREANFRPHRKSSSRSPPVWNFPRERYIGVNRGSLRFEARMKRTQSPFTKSSFTSDEEDNSLPSGGRFSSKYHSKWNDSRNDDFEHISDRSPKRMLKRNHWFDCVDSTGRTKFDEQFRGGMVRPGRCTDMTGRGSNYDSCDMDRRKHTGKYEMIHRVRRYHTNGFVKRYRKDAEDFEDHNIHGENRYSRSRDDRREIIRNTREERRSFRCNSGRTYTSSPKFSAIPDTYEDVSPRKR